MFLFSALLVLSVSSALETDRDLSYTCQPCSETSCPSPTFSSSDTSCSHGLGTDLCGCCPACYLGVGEVCVNSIDPPAKPVNQRCLPGTVCSLIHKSENQFICAYLPYGAENIPKLVLKQKHITSRTPPTNFLGQNSDYISSSPTDRLRRNDQEELLSSSVAPGNPLPTSSPKSYRLLCRLCDEERLGCVQREEDCPYGLAESDDVCCLKCAKAPGDVCGGLWGIDGACSRGYECVTLVSYGTPYSTYITQKGTCLPAEETNAVSGFVPVDSSTPPAYKMPSQPTEPNPRLSKCREPCSVKFCQGGANKYCSANGSIAINPLDERRPCQHTTCQACRLLLAPASCLPCPEPVTRRCMRHYSFCVDKHYETTRTFYLRMDDPAIVNATGEIRCFVPEMKLN